MSEFQVLSASIQPQHNIHSKLQGLHYATENRKKERKQIEEVRWLSFGYIFIVYKFKLHQIDHPKKILRLALQL